MKKLQSWSWMELYWTLNKRSSSIRSPHKRYWKTTPYIFESILPDIYYRYIKRTVDSQHDMPRLGRGLAVIDSILTINDAPKTTFEVWLRGKFFCLFKMEWFK